MNELNRITDYVLPVFGSMIQVRQKYVRVIYGTRREWRKHPCKLCGVFLGVRQVTNGTTYGTRGRLAQYLSYQPTEKFTVALFSPGPGSNPIYIPLDAITI